MGSEMCIRDSNTKYDAIPYKVKSISQYKMTDVRFHVPMAENTIVKEVRKGNALKEIYPGQPIGTGTFGWIGTYDFSDSVNITIGTMNIGDITYPVIFYTKEEILPPQPPNMYDFLFETHIIFGKDIPNWEIILAILAISITGIYIYGTRYNKSSITKWFTKLIRKSEEPVEYEIIEGDNKGWLEGD